MFVDQWALEKVKLAFFLFFLSTFFFAAFAFGETSATPSDESQRSRRGASIRLVFLLFSLYFVFRSV